MCPKPEEPPSSLEEPREKQPGSPVSDREAETHRQPEVGGPKGLEPTRYNDWEQNGRCTDF